MHLLTSAVLGLHHASVAAVTSHVAQGPLGFLQPESIIKWAGAWALPVVAAIIFAECGLLIGFFLPGDSLLFITGLLTTTGLSASSTTPFIKQPLWLVCIILAVAAVAGNLVGYWIGYRGGEKLFTRPDSKWLKPEYVERSHAFFQKYGPRAIILARFVPIVRTFITAIAGVGKMNYRMYAAYSVIGGTIWAVGVTCLGAWLGNVAFVKNHIELILIGIVIVSVLPIGFEWLRHRNEKKNAAG
jgi:membrane-associated protein